jgi:hypothetical protein
MTKTTDNVGEKNIAKCLKVARKRPLENIKQHRTGIAFGQTPPAEYRIVSQTEH